MMSGWVQDQVVKLADARHSQDMEEERRLGHDPNRINCQVEGKCRELISKIIKVVDD